MLSDVMDYYGLQRDFRHVGYYETAPHQQVFATLKAAIKRGQRVVLSGIVGCGKTTTLLRMQEALRREQEILVSKSLAVDKDRVTLTTLITALFYDLSPEGDVRIPTQTEKRTFHQI